MAALKLLHLLEEADASLLSAAARPVQDLPSRCGPSSVDSLQVLDPGDAQKGGVPGDGIIAVTEFEFLFGCRKEPNVTSLSDLPVVWTPSPLTRGTLAFQVIDLDRSCTLIMNG